MWRCRSLRLVLPAYDFFDSYCHPRYCERQLRAQIRMKEPSWMVQLLPSKFWPAIAVARDQVIDRVADHPWDGSGRPMSTASAEARAQCAARLRILHRPGRSPRTQRNPGDEDRCRFAQRVDG